MIERMKRSRSDQLIVPIRDRRQSRRYLTLRNAAKVLAGVIIVVAVVVIQSAVRRPKPGEYGRLYRQQVPAPPVVERKIDVVREAPVNDQTAGDPLLLSSAAREQILDTPAQRTTSAAAVTEFVPMTSAAAAAAPQTGRGSVTIVGGNEGVSVVRGGAAQQRPVLSGGIFKQR
jgi:hypothetical protein